LSRQYFSINREIFDIDFTSKSGAYDLQSRISSLVNGTLTRQMELFLEKNIPEEFLYKINTLTVEVGTVNVDNLEQELPEKFMEAFAVILTEQLRRQQSGLGGDNVQILPTDHSLTDLIDYFLYTGHLPWWAVKNESFTPSLAMEELMLKNPAALRAIIMRAGQFEHVRRRLVRQFSKAQIRGIISILEPGEAAYIFGFEEKVLEVKKTESFVKAEEKEFEQAVNYFILTYLIVERGGAFNRKEFAKSILGQIALSFNMQYIELLHVFYSAMENMETEGHDYASSLKLLIQELAAEAYEKPEWTAIEYTTKGKNISPDDSIRSLSIIRQYLVSGTLPFWISTKEGEAESIKGLLFRLASTVPDTFQLMLSQLSWNRDVADRLYELLGTESTRQYLKILYGSRAETYLKIAATFSLLHKTKQTWMVTEQVFEEAVWHSVLAATLLSPVNMVDDRQLVRLLLKGISTHLRVPVPTVVQRIQTGVKALFNVDQMQMRHLDLINEVLAETQGANELTWLLNKTEVNKDQELTESLFSTEAQLLSHLLRFFLQYGSLPWWGRAHAGKSPAMLFQQLNAKSPVEAQLVFKFAGASSQLRRRWLQSLGKESFLVMLQQVDTSGMVTKAYQLQLDFFAVLTMSLKKMHIDTTKTEWAIADISWQLFHAGLYQSFSLTDFYLKNFFAGVQLLETEPALLLYEWERWLAIPDNTATPARAVLHVLNNKYAEPNTTKAGITFPDENKVSAAISTALANIGVQVEADMPNTSLADMIKAADSSTKEKIAVYFVGVLKSYLIAGFLPPFFTPIGENERAVFFRQLLEIVYIINPLQLVKLLSATEANAYRVQEITSLYQVSEGGEAKDIALLMLPVRNKVQSLIRLQTVEEIKIQGKKEQEVFVEDMLLTFSGKPATMGDADRSGIIYNILRYYLTWNRLPDSLVKTVTISGDVVIRHFIRHLFSLDQHKLIQLMEESASLPSAIMSLYAILASSDSSDDKKILKLINGYLNSSVKQDNGIISLTELIDQVDLPIFSSPREWAEQAELENVIRSGSLKETLKQKKEWVSYLSEKGGRLYEEAITVYKNQFHSSFQEHAVYLENLLVSAFTDTLLREKVLIVLRYFNLQSAVLELRFRNQEEYFSLFLSYFTQVMPNATYALEQLYNKETEKKEVQETGLLPVLAAQVSMLKDIEFASDSFNKFYEDRDASITSRDRLLEQQKIAESLEKELKAAKEKERMLEAEEAALKQKEKQTKLFIPNAGLVILHPFFSTYFTRLGLMEASAFINEEAKERAVLLLQYLATGRNKFDEYELILNKLLCGMPIEQPVAFDIEPTDNEIALTEELFEVLKQRWDKVKNSTVEGIRASFIIREGALEFIEDQWNLRVEQRGYDMLLQTLPWAFGFIKTNWMNQILTVEWI
jgi:hypothetical protein